MKVLISGTRSGFGLALKSAFQEVGWKVVGLNRESHAESSGEVPLFDLALPHRIPLVISEVVKHHSDISCVVLNAGVLGPIGPTRATRFDNLKTVFDINFFSNKEIIDAMLEQSSASTFVQVSSGAAQTVYENWAPYGLTKGLMLRLFEYYRVEEKGKRFLSFNPGPMPTAMNVAIRELGEDATSWAKKFHDDDNLNDTLVLARKLVGFVLTEDKSIEGKLVDLRL